MPKLGWVAGLIMAVVLAGCGTPEYTGKKVATLRTEGKPPAATQAKSDEDRYREYEACMASHGIVFPKNEEEAQDFNPGSDQMMAAEGECRHLMPNGGQPPPLDAKQLDEMRAQAKCMREHGIDMPDPDPNNPYPMFTGANVDQEAMQKAFEECMGVKVEVEAPAPAPEPTK
jgi:hypothetical protein